MRNSTKKLTTAAVCTALAVVMCVFTAYLPLSFMPLYLAAFCIFLACKRAGVVYGALCAAASVGLMFLMTGLSVSWFLLLIMFAPYGIITHFIDRFDYFSVKSGIIRGLGALIFFNLTAFIVYEIAINVATLGMDVPITAWVDKLGGYFVFAAIATVVLVPLDFIFSTLSKVVLKRIPDFTRKGRRAPIKADNIEEKSEDKKYDDVFGYEIYDKQSEPTPEIPEERQDSGKSGEK